ncbi:MAG: YybH family protein [Gemmatimonadaceae bacterium]
MTTITFARGLVLVALTYGPVVACRPQPDSELTAAERRAIATTIEQRVKLAYDLGAEDVLAGMLSLYPREGRVYSASGGVVTTTRDSLDAAVRQFWNYVGRNMRDPKWEWKTMQVDVLSPGSAVMTATYRVPHLTPAGQPHVIGGAWTAVFAKRGGEWVIVHEHLSDSPSP